ncbi:MAG: nucleotidyltransferase domain-containing protein [Nanoarchaeota archaeon]
MKVLEEISREEIEKELPNIVRVLKDVVPSLSEVRVFGSYLGDDWLPGKSDVDLFVEIGDENYSVRKGMISLPNYYQIENKLRQDVRSKILGNINQEVGGRFKFHLLSAGDVKAYWNYEEGNRGPMGKSMKSGRLLYSSNTLKPTLLQKLKLKLTNV